MRPTRTRLADLGFALLLYLPVGVYYAAHFTAEWNDPDRIGTGFVQNDQPTYMACAREFIDGRSEGLLFALPGETDPDAKPTLVQLHLWALSVAWRITGADPGLLFVLFGAVFALATILVCMRLLDHFVRSTGIQRRIGQLLFIWGGGVIALSGAVAAMMHGRTPTAADLIAFDPGHGWWFLNLGRNFMLPNEAYYHFLFFLTLHLLVRGRALGATIASTLLVWSHPFAGPQLLAVVVAWSLLERLVFRAPAPPRSAIGYWIALGGAYAWYLFVWIPANAPHDLVSAIRDDFILGPSSSVPAYLLVGGMAAMRLRSRGRWRTFLEGTGNRLLLVMALVCLFLENHEVLLPPHQPAHFSRGYVWSALFLIGAPWLMGEAGGRLQRMRRPVRLTLVALGCVFILADNVSFLGMHIRKQWHGKANSYWLSRDGIAVLHALNEHDAKHGSARDRLLICQDRRLAHLAQVYTPFRTYFGHAVGPAAYHRKAPAQTAYFRGDVRSPLLAGPLLVVAVNDSGAFTPPGRSRLLLRNDRYSVFEAGPVAER